MRRKSKNSNVTEQLELEISREQEPDRNFDRGGRSFYFFDFDDNVLFLTTCIYLFHKDTNTEIAVSTGDFAKFGHSVGKHGPFKDYFVMYDDQVGSFRRFRDFDMSAPLNEKKLQPFIEDLTHALLKPDFLWKGPSWHTFYHASFNRRPVAVITARGHKPDTMKEGISLLVKDGHLPLDPNYLTIYPVSNPQIRVELGDNEKKLSTAELKQRAIMQSVEKAMEVYGYSSHHRFGMSDDDPKNIELIAEAMMKMKEKYPENSFFIIDTHQERYIKQEVFVNRVKSEFIDKTVQLELF